MTLTENEIKIVEIMRILKPFEKIEIQADQTGKPNSYIVHHSYKELFVDKK